QVDVTNFGDARYVSDGAQKLGRMMQMPNAPRVFNFSFTYPFVFTPNSSGSLDPLEKFIRNGGSTRLFVAAAGKGLADQIGRPSSCPQRPACLESPNVITVAASDLTPRPACPKIIADSNFGEGVDLIAPGERIVSSIAGNKIGLLSGSSQAAPIVTGAVSLLFAKNDTLKPQLVKNRLIYTADQCPELK